MKEIFLKSAEAVNNALNEEGINQKSLMSITKKIIL